MPTLGTKAAVDTIHLKQPPQHRARLSPALAALITFLTIFILLTRILPDRDKIDVLVRSASRALLFQRLDRFLVSSENPEIVILSSSIGLVPSQWADVAAGAIKYHDVLPVLKRAYHYTSPFYFLTCLAQNGFASISAIHLGMPTANVLDQLLILKNLLGFGKTPQLVVMMINPRDCLVQPCMEYPISGSPIFQWIRDVFIPPTELVKNRIIREASIDFRKGAMFRQWEAEHDYFDYEAMVLAEPVRKLLGKNYPSGIQPLPSSELQNNLDLVTAWTNPATTKLDTTVETQILASFTPKFLLTQCTALEDCAELLKKKNIHLLLVEVPLYPGIQLTESALRQYTDAIKTACKRTGTHYYRPADSISFDASDFGEILHMNASGGYKLYSSLANYIQLHKAELLPLPSMRAARPAI
jgi:hypothetical protein